MTKCAIYMHLSLIGVQNVSVLLLTSSEKEKKFPKRRLSLGGAPQSSEDTNGASSAPVTSGALDPHPSVGGPSAPSDPTEHEHLSLIQPKTEPEESDSEYANSKYQSSDSIMLDRPRNI